MRFLQILEDVLLIFLWIKAILLHFPEKEVQEANRFHHNGLDVHERALDDRLCSCWTHRFQAT